MAVVRRRTLSLARFILLLVMVSAATFLLLEIIPGDPVDSLVPDGATQEMRDAARVSFGLDRPLPERYLDWIGGVLHGDFGRSILTQIPVAESLADRVPVSLELALLAMVLALVVAIPVGIYSAYRPGGHVDRITAHITSAILAVPSFVLGIVLVFIFGVQLQVLPSFGWVPFSEDPVAHVRAITLPVLTLAAGECVLFIRVLKGDMLATLQQDHVLSARARGIPTWRILAKHALRQSSFSLVTVSGVAIGRLIGGAIIIESIFSLPGMGQLVVTAISSRDFIVVQAVILLSALFYLLMNTLVDLAYPLLDPRVRRTSS